MNEREFARFKAAGASKSDADQIMQAIHSREYDGIDNSPAEPVVPNPVATVAGSVPMPDTATIRVPVAIVAPVPVPATLSVPAAPVLGTLSGAKPSGATPAIAVSEQVLTASADSPEAPHDVGIYLFTRGTNGQNVMVPLERASTEGTKTGFLGMALTYGIVKGKTKAVIPGPHASIRANESKPVFYFYFEAKSAALGKAYWLNTVSNPNQFSIVRFDQKKDSREVVIGTMGFASFSTGSESKERVPFQSERGWGHGVYKVVPDGHMKPGEYAFVVASAYGTAVAGDIFDFAIKDNR